mmetsp:Transcript_17241/g.31073  ORF Transcript_17241/g.31073 Transcript_17241/m.31073 type:complete len:374 (-) Transcript_17241:467-1588(-)
MQPLPSKWKIRTEAWRQLSEAYAAGLDIWVSGASGSGKSSLVLDFFKGKAFTYFSGSNFESLKQVIKHFVTLLRGSKPKSADLTQLVWHLNELEFEAKHYLVIDKLELFLRAQPEFITDLLQVREALSRPLYICLIGEASCAGNPDSFSFAPVEVELSPYTKEETKQILKGLYRDMSQTLFESCFKAVEQRLSLETRQISAYKFTFAQLHASASTLEGKPMGILGKLITDILNQKKFVGKSFQSPLLKLSRQCKLLLAAAFLCSRTPASADVRVFKKIAIRSKAKTHLVAPKFFEVERMLAIFDVLASLNSSIAQRHSLELLASLKSLNEQGLIGFKGSDGLTQKMICLIDLEQFKLVCDSLEIRSSDYLLIN